MASKKTKDGFDCAIGIFKVSSVLNMSNWDLVVVCPHHVASMVVVAAMAPKA